MRFWFAAAAAALVAGAASAQAVGGFTQLFMSPCGEPWRAYDGDPYPVHAWFTQADKDHDGSIDLAEFRADHEGFFDALDQDHNGVLESAEISFYEKRVAPDVLLGQLYSALTPPRGLWGGAVIRAQIGGGGGYEPQGRMNTPTTRNDRLGPLIGSEVYGLLKDPEPVTSADTNLDGRVTKAEFLAAADRRFAKLDRKKDGKLTLDELPRPQAQVLAEAAAAKRAKKR